MRYNQKLCKIKIQKQNLSTIFSSRFYYKNGSRRRWDMNYVRNVLLFFSLKNKAEKMCVLFYSISSSLVVFVIFKEHGDWLKLKCILLLLVLLVLLSIVEAFATEIKSVLHYFSDTIADWCRWLRPFAGVYRKYYLKWSRAIIRLDRLTIGTAKL